MVRICSSDRWGGADSTVINPAPSQAASDANASARPDSLDRPDLAPPIINRPRGKVSMCSRVSYPRLAPFSDTFHLFGFDMHNRPLNRDGLSSSDTGQYRFPRVLLNLPFLDNRAKVKHVCRDKLTQGFPV